MNLNLGTLASYLEATNDNCNEHALHEPDLMGLVVRTDELLRTEVFPGLHIDPFASLLVVNAHMLYLAGMRQALTGHLAVVFPVVRSSLESACYAYLIARDPSLSDAWADRHASKAAFDRSRKEFGNAVAASIKKLRPSHPEMADIVEGLYQSSIDFGAHPNPRSLIPHVEMKTHDDKWSRLEFTGVYGKNSFEVNYGLLVVAEFGLAIAHIAAASQDDHPLLGPGAAAYQSIVSEKNALADRLNGATVEYPSGRSYRPY